MGKTSFQEEKLLKMLNDHGNANKCGECGATYPTWASWNLGLFLCGRCAALHRKLGKDISHVKSLSLDKWNGYELECLEAVGNKENAKKWNPKKVPFPYDEDDTSGLEMYIRDKYVNGKFRYTPVDESDYEPAIVHDHGHHGRRGRSNSNYSSRSHSRSRRSSAAAGSRVPTLEHRRVTASERSRYQSMALKLKYDVGFQNEDLNIEALVLAKGNLNYAAEILSQDSLKNGSDEKPPPLPRRPLNSAPTGTSTSATANGSAASSSGGFDWLNYGSQLPGTGAQQTGAVDPQVQIYQYVDPATGAVYYIDQNGQQYIDPSQSQQQVIMAPTGMTTIQQPQQQRPGLGLDNSTIVSLYNKPDAFVSVKTGGPTDQSLQATPTSSMTLDQQQQMLMMQQQQQQQQQMLMMQQQQQQQMQMNQQTGYTMPPQQQYYGGF